MSKNIAIVVPNLAGSGGEKVALTQAKMFYEKGHNVVLFLLEDLQKYSTDDIDFPIVALTNKKDKYKIFGKLGYKYYAYLLKKNMQKFGTFDLVLSNLPRADRTVKELQHSNKYFIIHISIQEEINKFKPKKAMKKSRLYKYLYTNENIITVSQGIIDDFAKLNIQYKTIKTIYNGFDFQEILKSCNDEVENINYEYIISPSAYRKQKRYDVVLDAFLKLKNKDIKLLILSEFNAELDNMIKSRGLSERVVVLGFQKNPFKYIKNAKLTILASDYEGFGMILAESLIIGTPVVCTNCPTGPSEIMINNLSKWLVPVNSPEKLAQKIDEALVSKIVINKDDLSRFDKENIYKEYLSLC